LISAAFLVITFIEISSHAFSDSEDIAHFQALGICGINHGAPITLDVPTKQKQRGPNINPLDEMMTHSVILNDLVAPRRYASYWISDHLGSLTNPLSGLLSPPFHPPKPV
jgi:hypothetical protein